MTPQLVFSPHRGDAHRSPLLRRERYSVQRQDLGQLVRYHSIHMWQLGRQLGRQARRQAGTRCETPTPGGQWGYDGNGSHDGGALRSPHAAQMPIGCCRRLDSWKCDLPATQAAAGCSDPMGKHEAQRKQTVQQNCKPLSTNHAPQRMRCDCRDEGTACIRTATSCRKYNIDITGNDLITLAYGYIPCCSIQHCLSNCRAAIDTSSPARLDFISWSPGVLAGRSSFLPL